MGRKRAAGLSIAAGYLILCIAAGAAPAADAPAVGDILLDTCDYANAAAAGAVWRAVGESAPVEVIQIDGRRAVGLPAGPTTARWRRKLPLDLTGRPAVQIDVFCKDPAAVRPLRVSLHDANRQVVAEIIAPLKSGWKTITVARPEPADEAAGSRWASVAAIEIAAETAANAEAVLGVTDLRIVGPDPLISLTRLGENDCIDLRHGAIVPGKLHDRPYTLTTRFGRITFAPEHVVGLRPTREGGSRVRVLLTDGQVFSGTLADPTIRLTMTIGEVMELPIQRIRQAAYRITEAKPLHVRCGRPTAVFSDSRVMFDVAEDFRFVLGAAHGELSLPPDALTRLEADADRPNRWRAVLRNGSVLSGALAPAAIAATVKLPGDRVLPVRISTAQVRRFRWLTPAKAPADATTVKLVDDERLYGRLDTETLAIKAQFGLEDVPVSDIVSMTLSPIDTGLATVNLWGDKVVRGRLLDKTVPFALIGVDLKLQVKADRIRSITTGGALSTRQFAAKIRRLIRNLDSADESERRAAFDELVRTGAAAVPLIRENLGDPNPAIRQRLLEILARID